MAQMTTTDSKRGARFAQLWRRSTSILRAQGALIAFLVLVLFGWLRYDGFLSLANVFPFLTYNATFGLIALGMTYVIMTGGIDLSVGAVAALTSVVAAVVSPHGFAPALLAAVGVGLIVGVINGSIIARTGIAPFIVTLAMLLAARGMALVLSNNASVSIDTSSGFNLLVWGNFLGIPIPIYILAIAYIVGALVLNFTGFGRHVLAVGGNEEAARLMGLRVERIQILVYTISGGLAGLAGALLAAQTFTGNPTEAVGWELSAIASVVVGGTLLTGGVGSVGATLVGVLLLGLIFNILNFENGHGFISLTPYWQSVIRGAFLLIVVILQSLLSRRKSKA